RRQPSRRQRRILRRTTSKCRRSFGEFVESRRAGLLVSRRRRFAPLEIRGRESILESTHDSFHPFTTNARLALAKDQVQSPAAAHMVAAATAMVEHLSVDAARLFKGLGKAR